MSRIIELCPLSAKYIDAAAALAVQEYERERAAVPALCEKAPAEFYRERLSRIFQSGIGRVALEDGQPIGFLAFDADTEGGDEVKFAASPLWCYGVCGEEREIVLGRLLQSTLRELAQKHFGSLQVSYYAHDPAARELYIMSAFFMETTDVIRPSGRPVPARELSGLDFRELSKAELLEHRPALLELYRGLIEHLRESPVFYHCRSFLPLEDRLDDFLDDSMRIFTVFDAGRLVGMIDSEPTDIDFASDDPEAIGMGDVFLFPEYRGRGIGPALLRYACNAQTQRGKGRIFVTHGTINPTARGFWDRYFDNYAFTMSRVIDACMLGNIEPL